MPRCITVSSRPELPKQHKARHTPRGVCRAFACALFDYVVLAADTEHPPQKAAKQLGTAHNNDLQTNRPFRNSSLPPLIGCTRASNPTAPAPPPQRPGSAPADRSPPSAIPRRTPHSTTPRSFFRILVSLGTNPLTHVVGLAPAHSQHMRSAAVGSEKGTAKSPCTDVQGLLNAIFGRRLIRCRSSPVRL